jgi:hypothetical protein
VTERPEDNHRQSELDLHEDATGEDSASETTQGDESSDSLDWVVHPLKRKPLVSVLVTVFILLCGLIVNWSTGMQWFAGLAMVIVFASLAKFYFPTRYRLDENGITIKTTTQTLKKEWSLYRTFYRDRNGLLLSPFTAPSRLENFRGLYLIFEQNGDAVTDYVRRFVREYSEDEFGRPETDS